MGIERMQDSGRKLEVNVWNIYQVREDLQVYMGRSLEERKESGPLFFLDEPVTDDPTTVVSYRGLNEFEAMNEMLKSELHEWPIKVQETFKIHQSSHETKFWDFIHQIVEFMPTPAIQLTWFELEKERKKPWYVDNHIINDEELYPSLPSATYKCANTMQYHVASLGRNIESEYIKNIFTTTEQEKRGEYKIELGYLWSELETIWLLKHWAMNIDVYTNVEGGVKGLLETQELLFSLLNVENKPPSELLALSFIQITDKWWERCVEEMQQKFQDAINSLDKNQIAYCSILQLDLPNGLLISDLKTFHNNRDVMIFWSKNLDFFLRIKRLPRLKQPSDQASMHPIEHLIKRDPKHMEDVLKQFQEQKKSSTAQGISSEMQENLMIEFLEFYRRETPDFKMWLVQIYRDGLRRSHEVKNNPGCSHIQWRLHRSVLSKLEFFRSEVARSMENNATV